MVCTFPPVHTQEEELDKLCKDFIQTDHVETHGRACPCCFLGDTGGNE